MDSTNKLVGISNQQIMDMCGGYLMSNQRLYHVQIRYWWMCSYHDGDWCNWWLYRMLGDLHFLSWDKQLSEKLQYSLTFHHHITLWIFILKVFPPFLTAHFGSSIPFWSLSLFQFQHWSYCFKLHHGFPFGNCIQMFMHPLSSKNSIHLVGY